MQTPIRGEKPQTNWPTIQIGDQLLVVRWTFFVTWLLSKRKVDMLKLKDMGRNLDPGMVDTMLEVFSACVAENFPRGHAPDAEFWAAAISGTGEVDLFSRANSAILDAVGKAPKAAQPAAPLASPQQPPAITQ
jgi:hypothetical protein